MMAAVPNSPVPRRRRLDSSGVMADDVAPTLKIMGVPRMQATREKDTARTAGLNRMRRFLV
jgi:hypothetical protein